MEVRVLPLRSYSFRGARWGTSADRKLILARDGGLGIPWKVMVHYVRRTSYLLSSFLTVFVALPCRLEGHQGCR